MASVKMKKLNLAIIGQGRSGKDIHGKYYISERNTLYNVKYVVDADEYRRKVSASRYTGCEVLDDYRKLLDKKDVDLVVNASYSYMHYEITKDLLEHNFNVLVEKPFARNAYECDSLIKLANERGLVLAVFQQTFFAPFYQDILRIMDSKILGDVLQVSIRYNGFSRRWDWQTLQKMMGGNAYNTGPHPFGIALGVLNFDDEAQVVFSRLKHTPMSAGDYDDYCKVLITAPDKPIVDVEINNTDAYSGYNVKLQGTKGCFKCNTTSYEYKYLVDGENPPRKPIETFLQNADGNPVYCSEKLVVHEEKGVYDGTAFDVGTAKLYEDVYNAITSKTQLYVTAERAKKIISVIETVHAQNPLPLKY